MSAIVIGVDEVGRGPLAGPVVAAAVALMGAPIPGLADSKTLSARRRAALEAQIVARCPHAIVAVGVEEIDTLNILHATMRAMALAVGQLVAALGAEPQEVLIDGNRTPGQSEAGRAAGWRWAGRAIVGGDGSEPSISAASIIAKQHRDRLMAELALGHPHYGWERNAGYGTAEHMAALRQFGPTPHHRRSFAPVAQLLLI